MELVDFWEIEILRLKLGLEVPEPLTEYMVSAWLKTWLWLYLVQSSPVMDSRVASCRPAFWKWEKNVQALKFPAQSLETSSHPFHREIFTSPG